MRTWVMDGRSGSDCMGTGWKMLRVAGRREKKRRVADEEKRSAGSVSSWQAEGPSALAA